jgi:CRISPR/Cas system-associated endonuclease/helicase Cas3
MPTRFQRDVDALNGDRWYLNYQIKECQSSSNKSSFCKGHHVGQKENEKHAPEISELFDDLDKKDRATWSTTKEEASDDEKLQLPTHRDGFNNNVGSDADKINDKNMKAEHQEQEQHLFPVSDHRGLSGSNYSPNIEARLSAKQFLAKQQNAVHEIEMKHQHLDTADDGRESSKKMTGLNEIQLRDTSSNSNFPFVFNLDTSSSSGDMKRSSGQKQQQQQSLRQKQHLDDQVDQKKNDLFDEVDEKLSRHEQQGLQAIHRVKRRDTSGISIDVINRLSKENLETFLQSQDDGDTKQLNFFDFGISQSFISFHRRDFKVSR